MRIIVILSLFLWSSCCTKTPTYIHGYLYNNEHKPLIGLRVEDPDNKNTFSISNKDGYFKINKMINGRYLFVLQYDKKIDSIYIVRTHPEKGVDYCFVEGRIDTLFINLK